MNIYINRIKLRESTPHIYITMILSNKYKFTFNLFEILQTTNYSYLYMNQ